MTDDEKSTLATEIAQQVISQVEKHRRNFWIEPEEHYNAHRQLDELLMVFSTTKSVVWKALIGLFITGLLALAAIGAKH